jgi:hypothetical protein
MQPKPNAVIVGASSAQVLGPSVLCVPSVDSAAAYVGDPDVTLVLADTTPQVGPLTMDEAVKQHSDAGGAVLILVATLSPGVLTAGRDDTDWLRRVASELRLPCDADVLARTLHLAPGSYRVPLDDVDTIVPDLALVRTVTYENPVVGYKCGQLWWDRANETILVAGAFAKAPMPPDFETICTEHEVHEHGMPWPYQKCYSGFSAWQNEARALVYGGSQILTVALSGNVALAGVPGMAGDMALLGAHQRVTAVRLRRICSSTMCANVAIADQMVCEDSDDEIPDGLVGQLHERCVEHPLPGRIVTSKEISAMLGGVPVGYEPLS